MEQKSDSTILIEPNMKPFEGDCNFSPIMSMIPMPVMNITPLISSTYPCKPININYYGTQPIMPQFEDSLYSDISSPLVSLIEQETLNAKADEDKGLAETVNAILSDIEKNNPSIIRTLMAYRMPYPVAKMFLRKIIKLTIQQHNK